MCLNPSSITQSSLFLPTVKGILSSRAALEKPGESGQRRTRPSFSCTAFKNRIEEGHSQRILSS